MSLEQIYEIELDNQVSLNFGMVVGSLIKLWIIQSDFTEKSFYCKNLGNVPKTGISEFIENVVVDTNPEKLVGSEEGTE